MPRLWIWGVVICGLYGCLSGQGGELTEAILGAGADAVSLTLTLAGSMTLWSGLMEILEASGDLQRLARMFRRIARPLFPGMEDDDCWAAMSMNVTANLLGLGNAATPAGMRAATLLAGQGEAGLRALAMLLVLNNSSLQLIPATVITLRQAAGSMDPTDIWLPTLAVSAVGTLTGVVLLRLLQGGGRRRCRVCRE